MEQSIRGVVRVFVAIIPAFGLLAACDSSTDAGDSSVASITFVQPTIVISQGESRTLAVQVKDAQGAVFNDISDAVWTSSDNGVLTISQQGVAQGVSLGGPVAVTISAGGKSATASVTVVPERIRFTPADSTIVLGQTLQLSGIIEDHNSQPIATNATISWSSADPNIATVDATSGLVTSVASGYAHIRATAAGRTTEKRMQIGVPTVYDGAWSGQSTSAPLGAAVFITFDVVFGRVKNFAARWSANSVCGPISGSALGTEALVASDGFELTLNAATASTVNATFTSSKQVTGLHTAFNFGPQLTCAAQGGGFAVVGSGVGAGTFTATRP